MLIVDAQVHIWSGGKPANPNHRQVPAFTKDELLKEMNDAGVDAALIHPPTSWDPSANELAVEAARQHPDRKSTRLNSSHVEISYAVFCLKKKKKNNNIFSLKKKK